MPRIIRKTSFSFFLPAFCSGDAHTSSLVFKMKSYSVMYETVQAYS
ncbi:hypothetical protein CKO_03519 [Citrobacter koseri ATCC BAA-895]|uniref:Uncharacterized protein n=1 Tax=Citrobacter koseri (strain ATCC BAA-895 / CDC 4225-83 / SGSC4696) TaxID=290338 RepID=A8AM85_CITK8|nr:hypothetical protein CKO_03519 [Citrobacter koseri ATCC BAA-895]